MQFLCHAGKFEGDFLQSFRLLRDDAGKGALSLDELVFTTQTLPIGHQTVRLGRGNAHLEDDLGSQEFLLCPVGLESKVIQLGQRLAVLTGIGERCSTLTRLDIVIQVYSFHVVHLFLFIGNRCSWLFIVCI